MKAVADSQGADGLNAVCPYFTMFPISFPLSVLEQARTGLVVDPFCGRGTTNLAARLRGCRTIGVDSSRVAIAATEAKLARRSVSADALVDRAKELICRHGSPSVPSGEFWRRAYHPQVLKDICAIRAGLLNNCDSGLNKALRAVMLGGLHGPKHKDGSSSYFSNQAPRTYAPKPNYAVEFWRDRKLSPPKVDVLRIIRDRATKAYSATLPKVAARTKCADSTLVRWEDLTDGMGKIRWIVTSPPYYGLRTYKADQWLRDWFMGGDAKVDYSAMGQLSHRSPLAFADDLKKVWRGLAKSSASDAQMVIRFGAINDRPVEPGQIIRDSLRGSGWKSRKIRNAGKASEGKRQAMSFNQKIKPAVDEIDVWCVRS